MREAAAPPWRRRTSTWRRATAVATAIPSPVWIWADQLPPCLRRPDALYFPLLREVAQPGQRTCLGSRGPPVQIRASRPLIDRVTPSGVALFSCCHCTSTPEVPEIRCSCQRRYMCGWHCRDWRDFFAHDASPSRSTAFPGLHATERGQGLANRELITPLRSLPAQDGRHPPAPYKGRARSPG